MAAAPAVSPGRTTAARAALQRADSALAFHVSPSKTLQSPGGSGRPDALPVRDSSAAFDGGDGDDEGASAWKTTAPRPVRSSHSLGARTTTAAGGSSSGVSGGLRPGRPVLVLSRADARRSEAPAPAAAAAHAFLPRWGAAAAAAAEDPSPLHNITASSSMEAAPGTLVDAPASARFGGADGMAASAGSEMRILSSPMFATRALRFGEEPPQQQQQQPAVRASGWVGRRTPIALTARPARASGSPPAKGCRRNTAAGCAGPERGAELVVTYVAT